MSITKESMTFHVLENGTREEISEMLQRKIDLNCTNENGDTVMHAILRNDKLTETDVTDILTFFVNQGVDPNIENKNEQVTVLRLAVGRRMKSSVDILLNFNADIQIVNRYGNTIAHIFIEDEYEKAKLAMSRPMNTVENYESMINDSVSFLEFLISKSVNFYSKNKQGETALHLAITYRLLHILPTLLKHAKDSISNDNDKKTLLELFLEGNVSVERSQSGEYQDPCHDPKSVDEILRILLDRVTNVTNEKYLCTLISKTIRKKRETRREMSTVETLINYYLNKYNDKNFATSLFHELMSTCASWENWEEDYFLTVLWDLVAQGVIVNNQLSQKRLVTTAMEAKNLRLLEFLKENGVDFGLRFAHGKKLLHLLAEQRDYEASSCEFCINFCNFLVCTGCDVDATNNRGKTPLHTAVGTGNVPLVVALIELGAEINRRDNDMKTPLHETLMMNESIELVKLLITNGADVNAKDYKHETPLHIAVSNDDLASVWLLIEHGASVNVVDKFLKTPLHRALAKNLAVEMVEVLLLNGADINAKDHKGRGALYQAISSTNVLMVEFLLANGAEVNARDKEGNRPLHCIFEDLFFTGSFKPDSGRIVTVLLKNGAHVNARNNDGRTALSGALYYEKFVVVDELLKYGADMNDDFIRQMMRTSRNSISPTLSVFFRRHWLKLRAADIPLDEDARAFMNGNDDQKYYNECLKEIEELKNTFIGDSNSVYDFLHMRPESGLVYVNNEKLEQLIQLPKLDERYPKYAVMILANYRKAKVFETREKVVTITTKIFIELYNVSVDKIVQKIMNYLQDEDFYISVPF